MSNPAPSTELALSIWSQHNDHVCQQFARVLQQGCEPAAMSKRAISRQQTSLGMNGFDLILSSGILSVKVNTSTETKLAFADSPGLTRFKRAAT